MLGNVSAAISLCWAPAPAGDADYLVDEVSGDVAGAWSTTPVLGDASSSMTLGFAQVGPTFWLGGLELSAAAAVLRLEDGRAELVADVIRTQLEEHAPYLGVVPEIAARAHAELADLTVKAAMHEAGLSYADLDGVAATSGPGLIGGVLGLFRQPDEGASKGAKV